MAQIDSCSLDFVADDVQHYSEIVQTIEALGFQLQLNDFTKEFYRLWYAIGQKRSKSGYIGILHSQTGILYPCLINRKKYTLTIAINGMQQFQSEAMELSENAKLMQMDFNTLLNSGLNYLISSLDVCVDDIKPIRLKPQSKRTKRKIGTTTYLNTKRAQKDRYILFCEYDKRLKHSLDYPLFRCEATFLKSYFAKNKLENIKKSFEKFINCKVDITALINMLRKT